MRTGRLPLHARVLLVQLAIVLVVTLVACATLLPMLAELHQRQYGERARGIGEAVAQMPEIRDAFGRADPAATIQPLAEAVRRSADVGFVVVSNRELVRYSHPNPALVGQPLSAGASPTEDDTLGLDGRVHVVQAEGSLGRSIRAKVPIFAADGQTVIGVVSVGILADTVEGVLIAHWPRIAAGVIASLLLGAAASYVLAGRIKRQLFGLEPNEIAALLEQREAMLHGIREGVVAVDRHGSITIVNDEARRVLDLAEGLIGWPVADVLPSSGLPEVLQSGQAEADQTIVLNGRAVVVSRIPVRSRGELVGAIATLRDQTETVALLRELSGARGYLEALRAQAHEFANKLHTVAGLIELGWHDRAVDLIDEATHDQQALIDDLPGRISDPALTALLVGKASVAAERGVAFEVSPRSRLRSGVGLSDELVTIVGNLIDNAIDATSDRAERWVRVGVSDRDGDIRIVVRDSGPGVPRAIRERIFEDGFSTKPPRDGIGQRGVGLALVRHAVRRLGGELTVRSGAEGSAGAIFKVRIPARSGAEPPNSGPGRAGPAVAEVAR